MIKIPDPVLCFYVIASLLGFFLRFIKDGVYKQLSLKPLLERSGVFLLVFLPFLGLLFLAQHFSVTAGNTIPYFAGASILSFLLSGSGLPSYLRGLILLGASVALTAFVPADFLALASALTGLIMVKLSENIGFQTESSLDDIVPPFIWLTSIMWLSSIESSKDLPAKAAVILGIMSVSILMRFLQGPFVAVANAQDDRLMVKRVVLTLTAGLAVLCVVVKLLNLMSLQNLAVFCGAGYFLTYLYKDLSGESRYALGGQQALRLLIYVGLLTLITSRIHGSFGLLALAPTAMVAPVSSAALLPGIYFASRALLQVYLQHFNLNVTGINLTHAYTSAAQYAGFILGAVLLLLLREKLDRRVLLSLMILCGVVSPVLSNFVLHSEPTCSLFASTIVSCFLLAVLGPALQAGTKDAENLALMPALMISSGILTSGLLSIGLESTIAVKTTVLSWGIVFFLLTAFTFWFFYQRQSKPPTQSTGGDPA